MRAIAAAALLPVFLAGCASETSVNRQEHTYVVE